MKNRNNGGYSLVEILVAIVLLGIVVVPTCGSLITAFRVNVKSEQMLQEQLAVSSAVETLMAEGITGESFNYGVTVDAEDLEHDRFPGVTVVTVKADDGYYYKVTVIAGDVDVNDEDDLAENGGITVETCIRAAYVMSPDVPTPAAPEGGATE